jgi:CHAT domain-containing protein
LDSGEHRKALEYFTQALPSLRAASDYVVEADTLYGISRAYDGLGELQKALESSSTALSLIENLRTKSSKSSEMRASYLASKQSYYFNHLDLLIRMHKQQPAQPYDVQAYQVSERMRARSLLDLLNESGTDIRQGVSPALLERERLLRQQFTAKGERQVRLLNSQAREEEQAAIAKEVSVLAEQYQQVQAQIRQQSPAYAALTQPQPLTLAEVQQHVLDNDTLLLQYSLGEKRSYLWTVTPTTMRVYELPPGAEITEAARRVYELMTARQPRPQESRAANEARVKQANAAYEGAARALSRMVLGPAAGELGGKRLAVVADGALQFVPFAALPEPQPEPASAAATTARTVARKPSEREKLEERAQPLLIRHEVVNLPSASSLAVLRQEVAGRVVPPGAVAVLADPVFSRDDSRLRASGDKQVKQPAETAQSDAGADTSVRALRGLLGVRGERLGRLAFSREEGRSINNAAPAGQALLATDFAANRRTAMSEGLGRYKYVHFATHGILNAEHPELSGIVLSLVDQKGDPQDGFLGLSEVYNLKLPVEMVTLSACQTGLGKEVKGEGLIGLTRGFMYAGTRRVLASLWQVEDQATAELMKRMYEKMLRSGERPAAALRAAQLEMMRSREQWRAPYYWAGFVMQGEWR